MTDRNQVQLDNLHLEELLELLPEHLKEELLNTVNCCLLKSSFVGATAAASRSPRPTTSRGGTPQMAPPPTNTKKKSVTGASRSAAGPRAASRPSGPRAPGPVTRDDLVECQVCSRRFATDRIQQHEEICARTGQKKRKVFDPVKARVKGTEAEAYIRKIKSSHAKEAGYTRVCIRTSQSSRPKKVRLAAGYTRVCIRTSKSSRPQKDTKKADWRRKHEDFIATIRAAKQAQAHIAAGGKVSDLPPPPPSDYSDYVQCPHCNRRFNTAAADRHIPRCATMLHNKPKSVSKGAVPKRR
uniref:C2HC/C3H-type domain-containing protein n=1 Tax=Timema genevievae TaxID=629358 RepID=A0A7R9JNW9_TIMGE|nr:unnamed protein product [Timema genevievae]